MIFLRETWQMNYFSKKKKKKQSLANDLYTLSTNYFQSVWGNFGQHISLEGSQNKMDIHLPSNSQSLTYILSSNLISINKIKYKSDILVIKILVYLYSHSVFFFGLIDQSFDNKRYWITCHINNISEFYHWTDFMDPLQSFF